MEEFYTVNQAAIVLKVHQLTIRRHIKAGKLKAFRAGGNIRIALPDLKAFIQNFVPRTKSLKEHISPTESDFSLNDPFFRLKARVLNLNRLERKE